jgi:hypothetical protein
MIGRWSHAGGRAGQERSAPVGGVVRPAVREGGPHSSTHERASSALSHASDLSAPEELYKDELCLFDAIDSRRKVYLTRRLKCLRKSRFGMIEV